MNEFSIASEVNGKRRYFVGILRGRLLFSIVPKLARRFDLMGAEAWRDKLAEPNLLVVAAPKLNREVPAIPAGEKNEIH